MTCRIWMSWMIAAAMVVSACDRPPAETQGTGPSALVAQTVRVADLPVRASIPTAGECRDAPPRMDGLASDKRVRFTTSEGRNILVSWSSAGEIKSYEDYPPPRTDASQSWYSVHWSRSWANGVGGGLVFTGLYRSREVGSAMLSAPNLGPPTTIADFVRRHCGVR